MKEGLVKKSESSGGTFDPGKRYAGVRKQRGRVEQDSDWNESSGAGRSGPVRGRGLGLVQIGKVLLAIIAVLAVGGLILGRALGIWGPTRAAQPTELQPIRALITEPESGSAYPSGAAISVRVEALGAAPIASVELWVDGELHTTEAGQRLALAYLVTYATWQVGALGDHTLVARAVDLNGQTAYSNAIHVTAVEPSGMWLVHPVAEGDTLGFIAESYGADPAELRFVDAPGAIPGETPPSPDEQLPAGSEVFVYVPPDGAASESPPALAPGSGAPADPPPPPFLAELLLWIDRNLVPDLPGSQPPTPPGLTATLEDCQVALLVEDRSGDEHGFFVYRHDPTLGSFERVATLGPHGGGEPVRFAETLPAGDTMYFVGAFNASGESLSDPVAVPVGTPGCPTPEPVTVELADLVPIEAQAPQFIYLYVKVDDGSWQRIPSDPEAYLDPIEDDLTLTNLIAPLHEGSAASAEGEVWGWKGRSLLQVGSFEHTLPAGSAFSDQRMAPALLQIRGAGTAGTGGEYWLWVKALAFTKYGTQDFRWQVPAYADYGLWQVATQPFPFGVSMNPPGLVLTDLTVEHQISLPQEFSIDMTSLGPEAIDLKAQPPLEAELAPAGLQSVFGLEDDSSRQMPATGFPTRSRQPGPPTYYVRLLPMKDGQIVGVPTNTVVLTYDPTVPEVHLDVPPVNVDEFEAQIVGFTPTHFSDGEHIYCVEVLENPNYPSILPWGQYAPGTKVCPKAYQGGNTPTFWGVLEEMVNKIAWLYNHLDDWFGEVFADIFPLCQAAKFVVDEAEGDPQEVDSICAKVGQYAFNAAKTFVGLPPSLPNWDQLKGMGKDYLVEQAAAELEQAGIPCPEECKDVIRMGIDETFAQLEAAQSNSSCYPVDEAHQLGIEPLCAPSYVKTRPDPRGQYGPAVVEIEVRRKPGGLSEQPAGLSCYAVISDVATNDWWIGRSVYSTTAYVEFTWQGEPIAGSLFEPKGVGIPWIAPGEVVTIPVALNGDYDYWLPGHWTAVNKSQIGSITGLGWTDWLYLYQGATVTLSLQLNSSSSSMGLGKCGTGDSETFGPLEYEPFKYWSKAGG